MDWKLGVSAIASVNSESGCRVLKPLTIWKRTVAWFKLISVSWTWHQTSYSQRRKPTFCSVWVSVLQRCSSTITWRWWRWLYTSSFICLFMYFRSVSQPTIKQTFIICVTSWSYHPPAVILRWLLIALRMKLRLLLCTVSFDVAPWLSLKPQLLPSLHTCLIWPVVLEPHILSESKTSFDISAHTLPSLGITSVLFTSSLRYLPLKI